MNYRPVILVCFQDTSEQAGIRCAVGTLIYLLLSTFGVEQMHRSKLTVLQEALNSVI